MTEPDDDIDRLMAIMQAAFDPAYGEAWTRRQIEDALLLGNCFYALIADHGGPPAPGEAASGFYLSRHGVEEEELLLLAVAPQSRRLGLASKLIDHLAQAAARRGAQRLLLEMRRGNPAEILYTNHGFLPIGERPRYYRTPGGDRLDAVTFCREMK